MIQIDDAGWGSLVGPVVIGAYRVETAEFAFGEIPMHCFQGDAFHRKDYLEAAWHTAREALAELKAAPPGEEVQVCTGYVLQTVRMRLREQGYRVEEAAIGGPLQILVETAFAQVVRRFGFEVDPKVLREDHGRAFFEALRWLKGGSVDATRVLPGRERWAKTGWESYPIWAHHPYEQARALARLHRSQRSRRRRARAFGG